MFFFWRAVGKRMNINDIPEGYSAFEQFNRDYERDNFRFSVSNQRIGEATRDLFLSWSPGFLRPIARRAIYALMDDALIAAFGFPRPWATTRYCVQRALKLRGWLSGWLPRRKTPRLRTEMGHASYPGGYSIETVGPPKK